MSQNVNPTSVPYIVYESSQARLDKVNHRCWILSFILVILLFATNGAWLYYEMQFNTVTETTTVTQTNDDGVNNFIGQDGEITNGESDSNEN